MTRSLMTAFAAALALAGCAAPAPAVIADIEEDKVIVESGFGTSDAAVVARAAEGCALHERVAYPVSRRCMDQYCYRVHHLFACLE